MLPPRDEPFANFGVAPDVFTTDLTVTAGGCARSFTGGEALAVNPDARSLYAAGYFERAWLAAFRRVG